MEVGAGAAKTDEKPYIPEIMRNRNSDLWAQGTKARFVLLADGAKGVVKKTVAESREIGRNCFRNLVFCASAVCDPGPVSVSDVSTGGNPRSFPQKLRPRSL